VLDILVRPRALVAEPPPQPRQGPPGRVDALRSRVTVCDTATDIGWKITFGEPNTPKSKRTITLARSIMREVEQHLAEYVEPEPNALVFTSATGNPLHLGTFWPSMWKPAVKAGGAGRAADPRRTADLCVASWRPRRTRKW
jgi:hypothetical protein